MLLLANSFFIYQLQQLVNFLRTNLLGMSQVDQIQLGPQFKLREEQECLTRNRRDPGRCERHEKDMTNDSIRSFGSNMAVTSRAIFYCNLFQYLVWLTQISIHYSYFCIASIIEIYVSIMYQMCQHLHASIKILV